MDRELNVGETCEHNFVEFWESFSRLSPEAAQVLEPCRAQIETLYLRTKNPDYVDPADSEAFLWLEELWEDVKEKDPKVLAAILISLDDLEQLKVAYLNSYENVIAQAMVTNTEAKASAQVAEVTRGV